MTETDIVMLVLKCLTQPYNVVVTVTSQAFQNSSLISFFSSRSFLEQTKIVLVV
jgi:hypothetical protein